MDVMDITFRVLLFDLMFFSFLAGGIAFTIFIAVVGLGYEEMQKDKKLQDIQAAGQAARDEVKMASSDFLRSVHKTLQR